MFDYPIPPESRGSQLVVLEIWQDGERTYSAYIRCNGSQYFFEGKVRGGQKYSRHAYFPRPQRQIISLGNREECIKFISQVLPFYGCPSKVISVLVESVRKWREE